MRRWSSTILQNSSLHSLLQNFENRHLCISILLRKYLTNSTKLFSLMSTTCKHFGLRSNISLVTAWPIEPAAPITKNRDPFTSSFITSLRSVISFMNNSREIGLIKVQYVHYQPNFGTLDGMLTTRSTSHLELSRLSVSQCLYIGNSEINVHIGRVITPRSFVTLKNSSSSLYLQIEQRLASYLALCPLGFQ